MMLMHAGACCGGCYAPLEGLLWAKVPTSICQHRRGGFYFI